MYYPQQSPGMATKLPTHHEQANWSRQHHPVLGPPQTQPPPPQSPGYAIFTNGGIMHPIPPMPHHHHQASLGHYPSPPHQQSPAAQTITPHWQQQLLKYDMVRASRSPHHRARASAMASRTVTKSAIPITNPNKPAEEDLLDPTLAAADANHPSSTAGPIAEAPRPTAARPPENTWSSLDMGGVNIKSIPPTSGLFSFTFLINLYLNHNALSTVPSEISKLRHLELLDLSGNSLTTLPAELGMLTQLKELYLFDNHISNLPPELGSLHQLQTLGVEGNPLDPSLKVIITKEGTRALIVYLRDTCPVPPDPPQRTFISLAPPLDPLPAAPSETFSVLCYNVLCEKAATSRLYGYTPAWALLWEYRKGRILREVMEHDCDFLCLQEVDIAQYEDYFTWNLKEKGYEGVYWPKSRYKTMGEQDRKQFEGCATFYKKAKYQLVEKHLIEFSAVAMQRQDFKKTDDMFNRVLGQAHIGVVCLMEDKHTGTRFIIVNTHIHWDPAYRDVKLVQVALLLDEVEKIANGFARYPPRPPGSTPSSGEGEEGEGGDSASNEPRLPPPPPPVYSDGTKIPLIICGDFNSVPLSGVYDFLSCGTLSATHPDFMSHTYGKYTSDGLRHRLGLKSAYATTPANPGNGTEELLPMTNYTPSFQGVIDYIWYSTQNVTVNSVLGEIDKGYLEKVVGFPNVHYPSDHVRLIAEFKVKPPRESAIPRPPPVFS